MLEIKIVKSTACLMLMKGEEMLDYKFINKFQFNNIMTLEDLKEEVRNFALSNNVNEYVLNTEQL